jgi:alkylation response protein AidB-like acyl-CoA dehydrogenase
MAVYVGVAAAAYRIACETLNQRVPRGFTQAMSYRPDLRRRVAEMSVDLEAARLLTRCAAWRTDREGRTPASVAALLRAKYLVGEAVNRVTRSAFNACGSHALFKTSPLERLLRDSNLRVNHAALGRRLSVRHWCVGVGIEPEGDAAAVEGRGSCFAGCWEKWQRCRRRRDRQERGTEQVR